jgi:hypothetical protein
MDRRSFIRSGIGVVGGLAAGIAEAQLKPCPIPTLSAVQGTSSATSCNIGAAADWQTRISAPGVVWHHNFDTAAEVNAFRWTPGYGGGNDPQDRGMTGTMVWDGTDGFAGGGCLRMNRPAGSADGSEWWRPFAPLTGSGNGRGANDPAANGTLTVRSYGATDRGSQINQFPQKGFYGHSSYHTGDTFDGTEYYLQVRVKMDPARVNGPEGGKLFYFTRTDASLTPQEIVTQSGVPISGRNYLQLYRSGSPPLYTDAPGSATHGHQPGSTFGTVGDKLCRFDNNGGRLVNCWAWPTTAVWTTLLYHIRPGRNSSGDTLVELWVCESGQTTYKQLWNQPGVNLPFSVVNGQNALICSGYMNGLSFGNAIYHKWTQMIFSKEFIPPPSV